MREGVGSEELRLIFRGCVPHTSWRSAFHIQGSACTMGAKWLFQLRSAPGQQTSTLHLFERFEALGAKKVSKWKTIIVSYQRKVAAGATVSDKVASDVYIVQFPTDHPDKVYMVIRQGDEDKVMEAGTAFVSIWNQINPTGGVNASSNSLYEQRVSMTVDGWAYDLGDLMVRVGSIVVKNQPAGQGPDQRPANRSETFKGAVIVARFSSL